MRVPSFSSAMSLWLALNSWFSTTSAKLTYRIAPYCLSKTDSASNPPVFDLTKIKNETCGEDDFVISALQEDLSIQKPSLFGVDNGVGGWRNQGIDPKLFTNALINSIKSEFVTSFKEPLKTIVSKAYENVKVVHKQIRYGSCTLALLSYNPSSNSLNSYNLGDSGFMLIRDGKVVWKSTEQQHFFNAPFQIGLNDGKPADSPLDADTSSFVVRSGDVVIVGTDGLFDNLFEADVLKIVSKHQSQKESFDFPHIVARELAFLAKRIGESPNVKSPFSKHAIESGKYYFGGKNDDTTVLVAVFMLEEKS